LIISRLISTMLIKIVIVDGDKLLDLLLQYNVGVDIADTHYSYKIDEGYFSE